MTKKIIILGGCGGIGRILVSHALIEGYEVHVVDLPESIEAHPPEVPSIAANATSVVDLEHAADALPQDISGFVNLSGFMDENCFVLDTKLDRWDEIINGNLTASYNAARAF